MRDLKAMYRQSYLGYIWIFAAPLVTTGVWLFMNSQKIVQVAETPVPYLLYVMVGTVLWTTFSSAVSQPLVSFNSGRPTFMKLKVAPEAFVAAGLVKVLFDLGVRLLLVVPVFWVAGVMPPSTALLFPFAVFCLLLLALAFGMLLVPLGALYQDVGRGTTMLLGFAMYLTPVVYPPVETGWVAILLRLNPVMPCLMTARDWLTLGPSDYVIPMVVIALCSLVVIFIATIMLRIAVPHLIVRMGM